MFILSTGLSMLMSIAEPAADSDPTSHAASSRERSLDERACLTKLDASASKASEALEALVRELGAVLGEMEKKTAEKLALTAAVEKLGKEKSNLEAEKTTLASTLASLQGELKQAEAGKDSAAIESLKAKVAAQDREISKQDGKIAKLAEDIAELDGEIAAHGEVIKAQLTKQAELEKLRLEADGALTKVLDAAEAKLEAKGKGEGEIPMRELKRCLRQEENARLERAIARETRTFRGIMMDSRKARCATALCWGPGHKYAFEPLTELPIGKSFAFQRSGVGRYVNGTDVQVTFNAGLRFWAAWDWVSVSVYLSKPLFSASDIITVSGSTHQFKASQVRRPFPGIGVGLFGDIIWLSVDWDQLRNGNGGADRAPEFRPNDAISHTATFTFAIAPVAAIRNGLGTLSERRKEARDEAQEQAKVEAAKVPPPSESVPGAPRDRRPAEPTLTPQRPPPP